MVEDEEIERAVSKILQRSERQNDLQKLLGTFVDVGILPQLDNNNNQIFYGRRGTGKTHVLRVLGSRLSEHAENAVLYIDARTLGSTTQFSDPEVPIPQRCMALFRDVLGEIQNVLLEHIVGTPPSNAELALRAFDQLQTGTMEPIKTVEQETITTTSGESEKTIEAMGAAIRLSKGLPGASVSAGHGEHLRAGLRQPLLCLRATGLNIRRRVSREGAVKLQNRDPA
jgi:hypothetical protein